MTQVPYGERIGRQGHIRLGSSAALFDEQGRIFLTRRADMFGRHKERILILDTLEKHPEALIK